MTELSMLYGSMGGGYESNEQLQKPVEKMTAGQQIHQIAMQSAEQPQVPPPISMPATPATHATHPLHAEHMQNMSIPAPVANSYQDYKRRPYEYNTTFWDRMSIKRPEVIKLTIFSLVIVFAIALDRMGTHYISKYINENVLTDVQEFLLRLSYPILVFLALWIAKSW